MLIDMAVPQNAWHYKEHLQPIFDALPLRVKGSDIGMYRSKHPNRPLLVAGYRSMEVNPLNRVIYVEHGAGQAYKSIDPAASPYYSGGAQHKRDLGFICPNQAVADRWLERYPDTPVCVAGSPRLDKWHNGSRAHLLEERTVAITFHWPANFTGVPETTSAFSFYLPHLERAVQSYREQGWRVIGTAHPIWSEYGNGVPDYWRSIGVEYYPMSEYVLDHASVLIADNTSMLAEFMSLGRPVVFLNCPAYRRGVDHGGRFWSWTTQGRQVDSGADLVGLRLEDLSRPTWHPYAFADGHAAQRAASFVTELLSPTPFNQSS